MKVSRESRVQSRGPNRLIGAVALVDTGAAIVEISLGKSAALCVALLVVGLFAAVVAVVEPRLGKGEPRLSSLQINLVDEIRVLIEAAERDLADGRVRRAEEVRAP